MYSKTFSKKIEKRNRGKNWKYVVKIPKLLFWWNFYIDFFDKNQNISRIPTFGQKNLIKKLLFWRIILFQLNLSSDFLFGFDFLDLTLYFLLPKIVLENGTFSRKWKFSAKNRNFMPNFEFFFAKNLNIFFIVALHFQFPFKEITEPCDIFFIVLRTINIRY